MMTTGDIGLPASHLRNAFPQVPEKHPCQIRHHAVLLNLASTVDWLGVEAEAAGLS